MSQRTFSISTGLATRCSPRHSAEWSCSPCAAAAQPLTFIGSYGHCEQQGRLRTQQTFRETCHTTKAGLWGEFELGSMDLENCVARCNECANCAYVSFSWHDLKCHWYRHCRQTVIPQEADNGIDRWRSVVVQRWRLPARKAPSSSCVSNRTLVRAATGAELQQRASDAESANEACPDCSELLRRRFEVRACTGCRVEKL